jgi:hypothetical protein
MSRLGRFVRRNWIRRILRGFVALLLLLIVGAVIARYVIRYQGEQHLAEQVAKLDADDPRWRWEEVEADQAAVPDAENSAKLLPKFVTEFEQRPLRVRSPDGEPIFKNEPPNRRLNEARAETIREALSEYRGAAKSAGQFRDYPRGRHAVVIDLAHPENSLLHLRPCDSIAMLLELDAEGQLLDGQPSLAFSRVRPLVHLARSIEGEPVPESQDSRVRALEGAARIVERSLAAGEVRDELAAIQSEFVRDSQTDCFFVGQRGQRALMHKLFERIESGEAPVKGQLRLDLKRGDVARQARAFIVITTYLKHNHAVYLEEITKLCAFSSLPDWEARAAIEQQRKSLQRIAAAHEFGSDIFTFGTVLRWGEGHSAWLRVKTRLRCAAVALAVERFRLANNRWPEKLSDLPPAMLNEVPIDPFDGKPLRYTRVKDGVVVYSVGPDGGNDSGAFDPKKSAYEPGQDIVFRLYDLDQRGLPPLPVPKVEDSDRKRGLPPPPPVVDDRDP